MAASPEAKFTEEKVLWIKHHTPKLMTFAISRPESYRFSAGQFSRLGFRDGEGFIIARLMIFYIIFHIMDIIFSFSTKKYFTRNINVKKI